MTDTAIKWKRVSQPISCVRRYQVEIFDAASDKWLLSRGNQHHEKDAVEVADSLAQDSPDSDLRVVEVLSSTRVILVRKPSE